MHDTRNIDSLVASGRIAEAIEVLTLDITENIGAEDKMSLADMYFRRGKLYWRLNRRGEATSDYAKASELNPGSAAVKALEQARDVEAFFNPDLYNP